MNMRFAAAVLAGVSALTAVAAWRANENLAASETRARHLEERVEFYRTRAEGQFHTLTEMKRTWTPPASPPN